MPGIQQGAATPYSEQGTKDVNKQITACWPQAAEIQMKGMISVSPDTCIFPYIEKC